MQDQTIDDGEIKALLMLLLLKTGTRPEEIKTALRMAAASRLLDEDHTPAPAPAPRERSRSAREFIDKISETSPSRIATRQIRKELEEKSEHPANCTCGRPALRPVAPKQTVRNTPLAPMRGYAA